MSNTVARRRRQTEAREPETVLRFTGEHLWVRTDGERVHVGLSEYGGDELGEIIAVELPGVGEAIERGTPFGELESVRTVQELIAPVTGTVVAVNAELDDHPGLVNEDPYHEGWLIEVQLDDDGELEDLMVPDEYEESLSGDKER